MGQASSSLERHLLQNIANLSIDGTDFDARGEKKQIAWVPLFDEFNSVLQPELLTNKVLRNLSDGLFDRLLQNQRSLRVAYNVLDTLVPSSAGTQRSQINSSPAPKPDLVNLALGTLWRLFLLPDMARQYLRLPPCPVCRCLAINDPLVQPHALQALSALSGVPTVAPGSLLEPDTAVAGQHRIWAERGLNMLCRIVALGSAPAADDWDLSFSTKGSGTSSSGPGVGSHSSGPGCMPAALSLLCG
ncbi:unnamed protein product, partial [Discosporangium mesarthrocarpum]